MPTTLPAELTDRVISECILDNNTLSNCAQVSTNWLPASRHALFKYIAFDTVTKFELFVDRVLHSDRTRPYLAGVLELYITDRSSGIPQYGRVDTVKTVSSACRLILYHLSGHLPRLESMFLWGINWELYPTPRPHEPLLLSQFPSLERLTLINCHFPSFQFVRRALVALPRLSDLTLSTTSWPPPSPLQLSSIYTCTPTGPELRFLSIAPHDVGASTNGFLPWLSRTRSRHSLLNLNVGWLTPGTGAEFLEFIALVSSTLQTLSAPLTEEIPLSSLRHVEDLKLNLAAISTWEALCVRLREVECPVVRLQVSPVASPEYTEWARPSVVRGVGLDDEDFGELDAVLMNMRHLKEVTFFVSMPAQYEDTGMVLQSIWARLPKAHKQGVIVGAMLVIHHRHPSEYHDRRFHGQPDITRTPAKAPR